MMKIVLQYLKAFYFSVPAAILLFLTLGGFVTNCFVSNTFLLDNRPLFVKPTKLDAHFSKNYENYFNDTFAGRKKLVKKFAKLKIKLGMDSGYTINGLNGWMFYDSAKIPDGYTLVDYYGEVSYTPEELEQIVSGMKKAKNFYAKQGIDYVIAVVPNKEGMYSEYMPERMQKARVSEISRTDKAISYVQQHTDVDIINWRTVLTQAKEKISHPLYFEKDSHWNNIGAYIAYEELARVLEKKGYRLNVPPFREAMIANVYAAHSDLAVDGKADTDYAVLYKMKQKPKNIVNEDHGFFQIWENPTAGVKKRILLNRDSQGVALMSYLEKDFEYGVYVHNKWNTRAGLEELIATYKPNVVVEEVGERYFGRFLKYDNLYGEE